jgi:DNA-directed RNA polymerase subunit beta'
MLWKVYSPMIQRRLIQKGYPATQVMSMVDKKDPLARHELLLETKERPVLINRAPTLHKHNIVAAYPVPTMNKTMTISPFIEKGIGGDFDGDAMQLHVPVSYKAVQEAKRMTLPNMLFTDKNKSLIASPELDANHGIHLAVNSSSDSKKGHSFSSYEEMANAYKQGRIGINTPVTIKDKK